ncbi:MAG: hypothetical protein ABWW70_01485 [Thermoproteota archaeon]
MSEEEVSISELRDALAEEVERLEAKLKMYKALLRLLEVCSPEDVGIEEQSVEFRGRSGATAARLVVGRSSARLVFTKDVPRSHPYVKYALRALNSLSEEYEVEVNVEGSQDTVKQLIVKAVSEEALEEAKTVLEFVARKISQTL